MVRGLPGRLAQRELVFQRLVREWYLSVRMLRVCQPGLAFPA